MNDQFPTDLQKHIYEFDPTFHEVWATVNKELRTSFLMLYTLRHQALEIILDPKRFLRKVRKQTIRDLAYFTRTKLPRRFTKHRALITIMFNSVLNPSSHGRWQSYMKAAP